MGTSKTIRNAIDGRRCLILTYRNYSRVVEPYVLGVDARGVEVLCAYQVSGGDEQHVPIGWKTFDVRAIGGAAVLGECFSGERAPVPDLETLAEIRSAVAADVASASQSLSGLAPSG